MNISDQAIRNSYCVVIGFIRFVKDSILHVALPFRNHNSSYMLFILDTVLLQKFTDHSEFHFHESCKTNGINGQYSYVQLSNSTAPDQPASDAG